MAGSQQYIHLSDALEVVTADNIIQSILPATIRDQILTQLPSDGDVTESFTRLTSEESTSFSRYNQLLELGYAAAVSTENKYPPVTPADDGARAFLERIIGQLATNDQNQALIISFVAAMVGEVVEGELEEEEEPSSTSAPGVVSVPAPSPSGGSKSNAGPGKRFYCHQCGSKFQYRRDMKRHWRNHFPGHEVDALDEEWEVGSGRWGPWTVGEARALGRDKEGMKEG